MIEDFEQDEAVDGDQEDDGWCQGGEDVAHIMIRSGYGNVPLHHLHMILEH